MGWATRSKWRGAWGTREWRKRSARVVSRRDDRAEAEERLAELIERPDVKAVLDGLEAYDRDEEPDDAAT